MTRKALIILYGLGIAGYGLAWWISYPNVGSKYTLYWQPTSRTAFSVRSGRCYIYSRATPGQTPAASLADFPIRFPGLKIFRLPQSSPRSSSTMDYAASVPCWMPMAILVAYPVIALTRTTYRRRRLRRHRLLHNLCLGCGYPMRGLPSPKCPECGSEFWILQP